MIGMEGATLTRRQAKIDALFVMNPDTRLQDIALKATRCYKFICLYMLC
jgi:hypothetical protein